MPIITLSESATIAPAQELAQVGTVFNQVMSWVTGLMQTIVGHPILLLPVGLAVGFTVFKLVRKLMGR